MKTTLIYKAIRQRLTAVSGLKLITYWNEQDTEGTIHTVPAVYIEFPEPAEMETLGYDDYQQADMRVRVHLYTKLLSLKDGSVPDALMEAHENLAQQVFTALHLHSAETAAGEPIYNSMMRSRFDFDMSSPGWAVTRQDFTCEAYQLKVEDDYTMMSVPIEIEVVI